MPQNRNMDLDAPRALALDNSSGVGHSFSDRGTVRGFAINGMSSTNKPSDVI